MNFILYLKNNNFVNDLNCKERLKKKGAMQAGNVGAQIGGGVRMARANLGLFGAAQKVYADVGGNSEGHNGAQ